MIQDVEDFRVHARLRDLAAMLDRTGQRLVAHSDPEVIERASAVLRGPGAAMVLTLRVDAAAVAVELVATGAASGRVVVAALSALRARPGPKQKGPGRAKPKG